MLTNLVGDVWMLDFIVLGIVPGTTFVITLRWVLLAALILCVIALMYLELKKPRKASHSRRVSHPAVNLEAISTNGLLGMTFFSPGRLSWLDKVAKKD